MSEFLHRLGSGAARRPWLVIFVWVTLLIVGVSGFAVGFKGVSTSFDIPGTAAGEVVEELQERLPEFSGGSGLVVYRTDDGSPFTEEQQEAIAALADSARGLRDVSDVVDPFAAQQQLADQTQQLDDGRAQLDAARAQTEQGQAQLDAALADIEAAQTQLDAARSQIESAPSPEDARQAQLTQLDNQQSQLDAARAKLDAQQQQLSEAAAQIEASTRELESGAELLSFADGVRTVSEDGSIALVAVTFDLPRLELPEESKQAVIAHFEDASIARVEVAFSSDIAQGIPEILGIGEAIGVVIAAIVLLVVLGSVLAASFPLVTAITGVAIAVLGALSFSGVIQIASFTPVLAIMLGLAVGIDYSLFILYRHRTQLIGGAGVAESIALANGTAGNAVVFAGATVVVALLALNVVGIPFLGLMGTVGAFAILIAVLMSVTMTPALLSLAGVRVLGRRTRAKIIDRAAAPALTRADAARASVRQMSTLRAVVTSLFAITVLLVLAIPALSMRLGLPDGGSEASDSTAYRAFTWTQEGFGEGVNGPLLVTADLPAGLGEDGVQAAQLAVARELAAQDDVVAVAPIGTSTDSTLTAFQVVPAEGPNSESTDRLVRDLRDLPPVNGAIELGVSGQTAINIDISAGLAQALPGYLVVVVGLSFLIMVMVFRSLLVPLLATGGFILSLLATYGALTAVFQWGWLGWLFGVTTPGPVLSFLPVILVGILFGLAMDYTLFLTTGMREAFVHGASARVAVARGVRAGRTVVVAAAIIMISVFGGFVSSESILVKGFGFGLAVGVLLDAFLVRMLLIPAVMHLLGRSAWWLPRWLDRIIPDVDVEGASLERRHPRTSTSHPVHEEGPVAGAPTVAP
ncbi:MMPL family transporter [Microbacterium invictum]|uniref:MMPL family transporter n=1 Tax=Microbacterium invictum TaxID=515415 RepID=A0ABZ0VF17_9MICO|nr:MMPL family transporter [Microbacterium invictum]WQB71266.1 MMPL family transporter [Microbacterium invictum]